MNDNKLKTLVSEYSLEHIAIIMDGNGRWAKNQNKKRTEGHKVGTERVIEILEEADELGIKAVSLYAFSTENWKRPEDEVKSLFEIMNVFIDKELIRFIRNNMKLAIMGDISSLPFIYRKGIEKAIKSTESNDGMVVNIGLNYGSKNEILHGIKGIYEDINKGKLSLDDLNENTLSDYLFTSGLKDPDLLIRTGGEKRLSNFMLYQLAYSEFYFTDTLWPDFDKNELEKAIISYCERDRRYGGLNEV